ncbi:MAG: hypothetical protein V1908_01855 [Candidatus Peregrinibacteria bacterium]
MKILLTILLLFVLVDALIVGYVIYRRWRKKISPKRIEEIRRHWKEIIRNPDHRYAIMEADKLLDLALGEIGYRGNLGAKLKKAPRLFSSLNDVWAAHKVRNNIAHQLHYKVDEGAYKKAMLAFKQAFQDLKIF